MTNLRDTQTLLWRLIRAPEGVAAALPGGPASEPPLDGVVRGDERMSAIERVEVYANMYFFRLLDALAEDFPALHAALGHERFHGLAADYLEAHPSEHPSLRQLGRRLSDFLASRAVAGVPRWLADLARFEWTLLEAFDAPDAVPLSAETLAALADDDWAGLRVRLSPSLRVLELSAPVQEFWSAVSEQREAADPAPSPTCIRVWREDLRVFHRAIDAVEADALRRVREGASFGSLCEAVAVAVGDDAAAQRAFTMLRDWIGDGLVVGSAG